MNNVQDICLSGLCVPYNTSTGQPLSWLFLIVGHKLVMVGQMPTKADSWLCHALSPTAIYCIKNESTK